MDWFGVLRRIEAGADSQTELLSGPINAPAVGKNLCAFANGNGGLLVLGVDPEGRIIGIKEDPERVQDRLTDVLRTSCGRPISAACCRHSAETGWVHWVEVRKNQCGYEPFTYDGRFWIRRGRSSEGPSPSELQELFNAFGLVLTERQIISSASVEDIDLGAFCSFMRAQGERMEEGPQPDILSDLRNSSVCDWLDGELRPTLYGLMTFGRDPQAHLHTTSMFIQCAAYAGSDRASDVMSAGEGKGRLDEQVRRSVGWYRSLGRSETYRGLLRSDIPPVPEAALREAVVNAVIHRDYAIPGSQVLLEVFADRIDVTSPGTFPNHMTVDQVRFGGAPRSRNEMMANAMVVRRLMERRGRGWMLMRHAMRAHNGTEPGLTNSVDGRFVRVSFCLDSCSASVGD